MAQEDKKQLLLQDLSARLPYGVKVQYNNEIYNIDYISALYEEVKLDVPDNYTIGISEIKPYLRPMSSMTDEEKKTFSSMSSHSIDCLHRFLSYSSEWYYFIHNEIDWLNAHHFDYRGLIERGLALEAPNEIYNN